MYSVSLWISFIAHLMEKMNKRQEAAELIFSCSELINFHINISTSLVQQGCMTSSHIHYLSHISKVQCWEYREE